MRAKALSRVMLVTAGVLVGLAAGACANGDGGQPSPTGSSGPPATSGSAPPEGTRIAVTETEYSIEVPSDTLAPGAYTVAVENAGGTEHDLVIKGPGVDEARTEVLDGGQQGTVTVALRSGTYELWCSVGDHRARGMDTTLTVG